jgi:hypothetical protein
MYKICTSNRITENKCKTYKNKSNLFLYPNYKDIHYKIWLETIAI